MVTAATRAQLRRVTDNAGMLMLLVISSPGMATARVVNDTRDWVIGGDTYIGLPFSVKLPQDVRGQPSRATLMLDNVGRDLGDEIEARPPGAVLMATMRAVSRARPTEVDYEFTSALSGVKVTTATISAVLGNEDALQAPAVKVRYDPATTPAVFGT